MSMTYNDIRKEFEKYFGGPDTCCGLCNSVSYGGKDLIHKYAQIWPFTAWRYCAAGRTVENYIIPSSRANLDWESARTKYDFEEKKQLNPLRKEFANFLLAGVAEEEGVRHTPIL